ncbi:MAG TPA: hypothetical protein VGL38_12615 [bacterium]
MTGKLAVIAGVALAFLLLGVGCDQGVDDWSSSARVTGEVFTDATHTHGIPGVRVILEGDPSADHPYDGPDRWTQTDNNGHFEGAVFLGNKDGAYTYLADMSVGYFYGNKAFTWKGGITVGPGSVFTLPPVDTTMFSPLAGNGGQ